MRIVSWNVNGLQPTLKDAAHRFTSASVYFTTILHADIVCFQEAKIQEEKLEKWMACVPGFESFWAFNQAKKGFSGVVTYVKNDLSPLDAVAEKLPGDIDTEDLRREGRIIETDHGSFVLVNVYVPNAGDREEGRPRLDFKVRFLQALQRKCDDLVRSGRHVVVVGDFNIAHKAIDVHQKWNVEEVYSSEELTWLDSFLTEYVDLFRHFHPDVKDIYSVWEPRTNARAHNEGLRIDYAVCDKGFLSQVKDTQILKMVPKTWSDHAAVVLTLQEQPALPTHPSPSISSQNMKRFQEDHRQKKLTSLFSRGASKPMTACHTEGTVPNKEGNTQNNTFTPLPVAPKSGGLGSRSSGVEDKVEQSPDTQKEAVSPPETPQNDLGSSTSSGVVDKLEQSPERQKEAVFPRDTSSNKDESPVTKGEPFVEAVCQAPGSNGTLGRQLSAAATGDDLHGIQAIRQSISSFEQPNLEKPIMQGKTVEVKADDLNSKNQVSETGSGLESAPDVLASANTEGGSPYKRKQPSTGLIETGGVAGKQRNLNSYFKVTPRDTGASAEEKSK